MGIKRRERHFSFLNDEMQKENLLLLSRLKALDLLRRGFVSALNPKSYNASFELCDDIAKRYVNDTKKALDLRDDLEKTIHDHLPLRLSVPRQGLAVASDLLSLNESYFQIMAHESRAFVSFYHQLPFAVVGPQGALKHLKSLGYKTFPTFFSDSYDEKPHYIDRVEYIVQRTRELVQLSQSEIHAMYLACRKDLRHNHALLMKKKSHQILDLSLPDLRGSL